jgi:DNA polymerase-3 subunit gamma/tau
MALPDDDSVDGRPPSLPATGPEDPREPPPEDRPATGRGAPVATPAQTQALVPPPGLQPTELGESWARTVREMAAAGLIGALVREAAMQAELVAIDLDPAPETWRLRIDRDALRTATLIDKLQSAVVAHHARPLRLAVEPGPARDSPALRETVAREQAQRAAEAAIRDDPAVQALLSRFPTARIVPGSIRPA